METITELPLLAAQSDVRSLRERQAATRAVLDSFMEQEEAEHKDTLRVLRQALGKEREGQRSIFGEKESVS